MAIRAADYIRQAGATAVAGPDYKGSLSLAGSGQVELADYATCDLAVCLGGDGTFLSLVHLVGHESIPVIGVNLGSVAAFAGNTSRPTATCDRKVGVRRLSAWNSG